MSKSVEIVIELTSGKKISLNVKEVKDLHKSLTELLMNENEQVRMDPQTMYFDWKYVRPEDMFVDNTRFFYSESSLI